MSAKFGKCRLCPQGAAEVRLYGSGLCSYHLNYPDDDHSKQKVIQELKSIPDDKLLNDFYREQWRHHMTSKCENGCGTRLLATTLGRAKFFICHIVPKKNFDSVKVHPSNRWFGCWQCHSDFDSNWQKAVTMPVWPLVAERFTQFMHFIKDTELKHLPDALRTLMDQPLKK